MSVRNGVTVSSTLTAEVPSLHDTLITLTLGDSLDINELADAEVAWTKTVADG
jgi:hypothetical protein